MNKPVISTKEELISDIENIKKDIEWAKLNDVKLLDWLEECLKQKQEILMNWISSNHK